jgi:hypothetical protein
MPLICHFLCQCQSLQNTTHPCRSLHISLCFLFLHFLIGKVAVPEEILHRKRMRSLGHLRVRLSEGGKTRRWELFGFDCFGHDTILYYRTSPRRLFINTLFFHGSVPRDFGHFSICRRYMAIRLEATQSIQEPRSVRGGKVCDLERSFELFEKIIRSSCFFHCSTLVPVVDM